MKLKHLVGLVLLFVVAGTIGFVVLSSPLAYELVQLPVHEPDLKNGEKMFWAGGCASCHSSPDSKLLLSGGQTLSTPFGVFSSPNISPDQTYGIGAWSMLEFVNAMLRGISPDGQHYYPAFPYTYYKNMYIQDVMDLKAFLDTLPAVSSEVAGHDMNFPYSLRRGIGLWKRLYFDPPGLGSRPAQISPLLRGEYLVEGPGHCGACHTARDKFGGPLSEFNLAGARSLEIANASGDVHEISKEKEKAEWIPNITPHADGLSGWSVRDIAYLFETGFTPDFDTIGSSMVEVQENLAQLPRDDLDAIAAYLRSIPSMPNPD